MILVDDCYRGVVTEDGQTYKFVSEAEIGLAVTFMCDLESCVDLCTYVNVNGAMGCIGVNFRVDNVHSSEACTFSAVIAIILWHLSAIWHSITLQSVSNPSLFPIKLIPSGELRTVSIDLL